MAVQWLGGLTVDVGATVQYLLLGIAYSLLLLMIVSLFRTRKRLIWLLGTLVVSGTFQVFYGAFIGFARETSAHAGEE